MSPTPALPCGLVCHPHHPREGAVPSRCHGGRRGGDGMSLRPGALPSKNSVIAPQCPLCSRLGLLPHVRAAGCDQGPSLVTPSPRSRLSVSTTLSESPYSLARISAAGPPEQTSRTAPHFPPRSALPALTPPSAPPTALERVTGRRGTVYCKPRRRLLH